jgi:hypothetical protein
MLCLSELVSSGKLQQQFDTSSWGGPVNNYNNAGHNNNSSNSYGIPAGRVGKNPAQWVILVFLWVFGFFLYLPRRESF